MFKFCPQKHKLRGVMSKYVYGKPISDRKIFKLFIQTVYANTVVFSNRPIVFTFVFDR